MVKVTKIEIQSINDIKTKYPNAFKYLMSKMPTSISINGWYIELHCAFSGCKLIYDQDDIKHFNMLHEVVNLTPKLDIDFSGFEKFYDAEKHKLKIGSVYDIFCSNNNKIISVTYNGDNKFTSITRPHLELNIDRIKLS